MRSPLSRRFALAGLLFAAVGVGAPASAAVEDESLDRTPIGGREVRFESADGVQLFGNVFDAKDSARSVVVFVHGPNRSARDFAYLAEKMTRQGITSLVFDLRGHGRSMFRGKEELDREIFGDEDYAAMIEDVRAALAVAAKLPGASRLQVAGDDLGGSLALLAAIENPAVSTVALLSPGLGYDGVNIAGVAGNLSDRPLLLVYSSEDGYSRKSTEVIAAEARGPHHVQTWYGVGHGSKMLTREPDAESFLTGWFLGTVLNADGRRLEDAGKPVAADKGTAEAAPLDAEAERKRLEAERKALEARRASGGVGDDEERPRKYIDPDAR